MTTIMLHAPDKATMDKALLKYKVLETRQDENGVDYLTPAKTFEVTGYKGSILPPIWSTKPVYALDGTLTTPGVEISGFSCNVLDTRGVLETWTTDPATGVQTHTFGTYSVPNADPMLPPTVLPIDWPAMGVAWVDPAPIKTPAQSW